MRPVVLLALLLSRGVSPGQEPPRPTAGTLTQSGVTVTAPTRPGWTLAKADRTETRFERSDGTETAILRARTMSATVFGEGGDLLARMETWKDKELNRLKRDSIHFNHVRFKRLGCLQYDGIFEDASRPKTAARFNVKGILCPLAGSQASVIELEVSAWSGRRGLSESLIEVSDEFFHAAVFQGDPVH